MTDENRKEQKIEVQEGVMANMTAEQLSALQKRVEDLVNDDENFNLFMSVMITAQQLYALARYSLQRECEKESIAWEDGVEEFIIKAAREHSLQPISRPDVLRKVQGCVLKFLTEEIDMQLQDERAEQLRAKAEDHDKRMATKVNVCIGGSTHELERGTGLVVWGKPKHVEHYLRSCCGGETDTTLYCKAENDKNRTWDRNLPTVRQMNIGMNRWSAMGTSPAKLDKLFKVYLERLHHQECDLVKVDNLPFLGICSMVGRSRVRVAADAFKTLRKWAKEQGAAIVVGIPVLNEDEIEFGDEVNEIFGEHNKVIEATTCQLE